MVKLEGTILNIKTLCLFELDYLNLATWTRYENNLWHLHKLFSAYFDKLFRIAYEKSL